MARRRSGSRLKQTRKKIRGGAKIGEGVQGDVFRPPLQCTPNTQVNAHFMTNAYVGKQVSDENAGRELLKANNVNRINRNGIYTIRANTACRLNRIQQTSGFEWQNQRQTQLFSRYGGESVASLLQLKFLDTPKDFSMVNPDYILEGLRAIRSIIPHLREFHRHFVHNDLHVGNIVWDGTHARLIDFTDMEPVEHNIENLRKKYPTETDDRLYFKAIEKDMERLYKTVLKVLQSKYIQSNEQYRNQFRIWILGTPKGGDFDPVRSLEIYYHKLETLPV